MTQEQILDEVFSDLIARGRKEGREKGREEGREEGRTESKTAIVKNMLQDHLPLGVIVKYCSLSAERIREIAGSIGVPVVAG